MAVSPENRGCKRKARSTDEDESSTNHDDAMLERVTKQIRKENTHTLESVAVAGIMHLAAQPPQPLQGITINEAIPKERNTAGWPNKGPTNSAKSQGAQRRALSLEQAYTWVAQELPIRKCADERSTLGMEKVKLDLLIKQNRVNYQIEKNVPISSTLVEMRAALPATTLPRRQHSISETTTGRNINLTAAIEPRATKLEEAYVWLTAELLRKRSAKNTRARMKNGILDELIEQARVNFQIDNKVPISASLIRARANRTQDSTITEDKSQDNAKSTIENSSLAALPASARPQGGTKGTVVLANNKGAGQSSKVQYVSAALKGAVPDLEEAYTWVTLELLRKRAENLSPRLKVGTLDLLVEQARVKYQIHEKVPISATLISQRAKQANHFNPTATSPVDATSTIETNSVVALPQTALPQECTNGTAGQVGSKGRRANFGYTAVTLKETVPNLREAYAWVTKELLRKRDENKARLKSGTLDLLIRQARVKYQIDENVPISEALISQRAKRANHSIGKTPENLNSPVSPKNYPKYPCM